TDAAFERNAGAGFGIDVDGEERLVLVQEIARTALRTLDAPRLMRIAREAIVDAPAVDVYESVLVSPPEVPKTSSGKLEPGRARERYLAKEFKVLAREREPAAAVATPAQPEAAPAVHRDGRTISHWLASRIAELRAIPAASVDEERPFAAFGVDSILAVRLS